MFAFSSATLVRDRCDGVKREVCSCGLCSEASVRKVGFAARAATMCVMPKMIHAEEAANAFFAELGS